MKTSEFKPTPIVIVGGGVAGLTAANLLARMGLPVRVFEANDKIGGCCAMTTIDGYTFHDGAVFLGILELLDHAFATIGLRRAELLPLRRITASSTTLPDGTVVALGEGSKLTVTGRAVDANRLEEELWRMMDKWQPVLRFASKELLTHPFSAWHVLKKGWRHLYKLGGTAASEFNRLFSDAAVRSALSGALLYNGMPAQQMPVSAILGLVAEIGEGLYVPEGGMGKVPQVLNCALERRGVPIAVNSPVEKILIENDRVCGVQLKGGDIVDASAVISTVSGMQTLGSMVAPQHLSSLIARKLRHPRLSHRAVSIQLGLKNKIEAPAHSMSVLPWMEDQQAVFMQDGSEVRFPVYLVPTVTLPELAPQDCSIIEMFYPVRTDIPLESWDNTRKQRLADLAIAALRRSYDLEIAITRVRSPRDFFEGLHLFSGALYGLSPAAKPHELFPHASGIPGLYLAGQTTFPGYGVGPAMMSGIFACEALSRSAHLPYRPGLN